MARVLRGKTAQYIFRGVVWVTLISMAGLGALAAIVKRFFWSDTAVAIVNGYEIERVELDRRVREESARRAQLRQRFGVEGAMEMLRSIGASERVEDQALHDVIREKVILSAADQLIPSIGAEYLSRKIVDPLFLFQGGFGDLLSYEMFDESGMINTKKLLRLLENQGIRISEFEDMIADAIKRTTLLSLIQGSLYVPKKAIVDAYKREKTKRTYLIAEFPLQGALAKIKGMPVDEAALQKFFENQNKTKRYWSAEKRSGLVWVFSADSYQIPLSEREIKEYYDQNKSCKFELTPEKKDADGTIMKEATYKTLESVKQEIRTELIQKKFRRQFLADAQRVLNRSFDDPGEFERFVQAKKAKLLHLNQVTIDETPYSRVLFAAGALERKAPLVQEDSQGKVFGVVGEPSEIVARKVLSFDEVGSTVRKDYDMELARNQLDELLRSLKTANSAEIKNAAFQMKGMTVTTPFVSLGEPKDIELLKKYMGRAPLGLLGRLTKPGQTAASKTDEGGFIVRLIEQETPHEGEIETSRPALAKSIWFELNKPLATSVVASLQKNANIKHIQQSGTNSYSGLLDF